jgi:ribosome-binding protein aMBF1 (putative translation factor)
MLDADRRLNRKSETEQALKRAVGRDMPGTGAGTAGNEQIDGLPSAVFDALVRYGTPVRAAREAAGLTLDELVERSGIDAERIEALEFDRDTPTLAEADALGAALAVPADFFIGDAD